MTLEEATQALLAAIEAEDLGAIAHALTERAAAIQADLAAGATPAPAVVEEGDRACQALTALKQRWALAGARLGQLQTGFARPPDAGDPSLDCRG